ncbi:MAG TPA: hypothetical protein VEJ41_07590 [Candidatus Acidoferrales bacterium]|nr:hypothetical protein [Candidatus Acidoferrales bacterium]
MSLWVFAVLALASGTARLAVAQTAPAPTQSPPPSLSAIMDRYATAIGGRDVLARITTQVSVFSFTLADRTIVVTTTTKVPSYYLQVVATEGGGGTLASGFDGKLAWLQDPSGVVQILSGQKRAELITDAVGSNNSEIFAERWPTTVSLKPQETIDGKAYFVVNIAPKDGVPHDMLLDQQTYQPMMDRTVEADATSISTVDAFGTGPLGELFPKSLTTTRSDGFPTITTVLRSVKDNVPVANSLFAPPPSKGTETI